MKKNFTLSIEANDTFNSILEQLTNETPGITQGEVLARIIAAYQNQSSNEAQQVKQLTYQFNQLVEDRNSLLLALDLPENSSLQDVGSCYKNLQEEMEAATGSHRKQLEEVTVTHRNLVEELTATHRKQLEEVHGIIEEATGSNRNLLESLKIRENQIIITLHTPAKEILEESCKRLATLFNREVTPADLLLDVFVRYSIEQYNEWFFPFVIKPYEMKQLTGYTAEELKAWLRGEPKKEA